jgi:hypothetical protein
MVYGAIIPSFSHCEQGKDEKNKKYTNGVIPVWNWKDVVAKADIF